jgi:head-tail adaptor
VTITTSDPPYVTPVVKWMLRKKNALMRSGKVEQAATLSKKIGDAIKARNTAEFSNVDVLSDTRNVWAKVRQLTGRSKTGTDVNLSSQNSAVTAYYRMCTTRVSQLTLITKLHELREHL